MKETAPAFRILSLDGGGIKGTYTAALLAGIESATGKRIVDHFDLIVGTSTGGILALALGLGKPAADILGLYEHHGPVIFPLGSRVERLWRAGRKWLRAKHSPDPLRQALQEVLGDAAMWQAETRLVIPAFDGSAGDVRLFKTPHVERFKEDYLVPMVDVALATSAAPTFFPAHIGSGGTVHIDGGVWANCPAAVAVVEALTYLDQTPGEIDLLSIGTTDAPLHVPKAKQVGGNLQWSKFGVDLLMHAQARMSLAHAKLLTQERMVRISEVVTRDRFSLDDVTGVSQLKSLGQRDARHHAETIGQRFLSQPRSPYAPYHKG
jgi:patatin-like phospholipase/acyl hydrolase